MRQHQAPVLVRHFRHVRHVRYASGWRRRHSARRSAGVRQPRARWGRTASWTASQPRGGARQGARSGSASATSRGLLGVGPVGALHRAAGLRGAGRQGEERSRGDTGRSAPASGGRSGRQGRGSGPPGSRHGCGRRAGGASRGGCVPSATGRAPRHGRPGPLRPRLDHRRPAHPLARRPRLLPGASSSRPSR